MTELYNTDELVIKEVDMIHYEVMDEGEHVWLAFYKANGVIGHLNIFNKDGKINTRYEEFDDEYSETS